MRKKIGILSATPGVRVYATWNSEDAGENIVLQNHNLTITQTGVGMVRATIGKSSGKWYWEITNTGGALRVCDAGVAKDTADLENFVGGDFNGWGYLSNPTNAVYNGNAPISPNHMAVYSTGDILMFALDMTNKGFYIGVNGIWQKNRANVTGVPTSGSALTGAIASGFASEEMVFPAGGNTTNTQMIANFGNSAFTYPVPAGYNSGIF